MSSALKKIAHPPDPDSPDAVTFLPQKEWEELFVHGIRYRAPVYVSMREGIKSPVLSSRLASFEIDPGRDPLRCDSLSCAVQIDRTLTTHAAFVEAISHNPLLDFELRMHLPKDLIRMPTTLLRTEPRKLHFSLTAPPFRQLSRRYARVSVRIPVLFNVFFAAELKEKTWVKAEGMDLSEGGVGFILRENALPNLPQVGELLEGLYFRVGGELCVVKGIIRHLSLVEQNQFPQRRFRVGVEFIETEPRTLAALRRFVALELSRITG